MQFAALSALARRQHGCIAFSQLAEVGVSESQWRRLQHQGALLPLRRGVAALAGAAPTSLQTIMAAVLVAGPDVLVSHTSAAHVWGVDACTASPVHVTLTDRSRSVRLPGVVAHRPVDLVDMRPVVRHGISVTNPLRILCDLGAVAPALVSHALEHFLIAGTVRPDAVRSALERHARPGRNGVEPLRSALAAYPFGHKPPDSVLEPAMARLAARHSLPPMTFHARICGWEVDFHVDRTPVVVECDGWSSHGLDRQQFERDRRKDADLHAAGLVVCRYSWQQITRQPRWVAANLRTVLTTWAPELLSGQVPSPFDVNRAETGQRQARVRRG